MAEIGWVESSLGTLNRHGEEGQVGITGQKSKFCPFLWSFGQVLAKKLRIGSPLLYALSEEK
jgi:hypothetical protein